MQPAKSGWLCWTAVFLETLPCQCSSGWTQHTSASRTFAGCGRFSALSPLLQRKWLLVVQPCVSPSHPSDFICVQWHVSFLLELALTFAAIAPSCSGLQKNWWNAFDGESLQRTLHHWMVSLWTPRSIPRPAISRSPNPCYVHMCVPRPVLIHEFSAQLVWQAQRIFWSTVDWAHGHGARCRLLTSGVRWPAGLASLKGTRGFWIWASNHVDGCGLWLGVGLVDEI